MIDSISSHDEKALGSEKNTFVALNSKLVTVKCKLRLAYTCNFEI